MRTPFFALLASLTLWASLGLAAPASQPATQPRLPLPTTAQLTVARSQVRELCRDASASPVQAARRLLDASRATTTDPALHYAAALRAMDLAGSAPDAALALRALDELTSRFETDAFSLKLQLVEHLTKANAPVPAATLAMRYLDEALRAGQMPSAELFHRILENLRPQLKPELAAVAQDLLTDSDFARKLAALPARTSTTGPATRPATGGTLNPVFACLYTQAWDDNLPAVAEYSADIAPLAQADLAAKDTPAQLAAAQAWWEAGQKRADRTGWRLCARAIQLYEANLHNVDGVHRQLLMTRLAAYQRARLVWQGILPGISREVWKEGPASHTRSIVPQPVLDRKAVDSEIPRSNAHVLFRGQLLVEASGRHEITFTGGTALRVLVDGVTLLDNPTAFRKRNGEPVTLDLPAGLHPFEIEVSSNSSRPHLSLSWSTPLDPEVTPIPANAFFHDSLLTPLGRP